MRRPNIADVARAAGVSKSTVSRFLNGTTQYMREETRQRILQAIQTLGYRPSTVARSLVFRRTHTAGLLVSDVGNPYYPEVIHGVEDVALAHGYDVFLCNTSYDLERAMKSVRSLVDKQVDGVLLMSSRMSDELVMELAKNSVPTVVLDWQIQPIEGVVGTISVDFYTGIRAAANHLVDLGHRRLAHVSGPLNLRTAQVRQEAFLTSLQARGIDPVQVVTVEGNFTLDGGRRALGELLALPERPTAVFAANDLTAIGIVWAARDYGLRIPGDLSVVGLDNIQLAAQIDPPLTTVELPRYEVGTLAMRMLLELVEGSQEPQSKPMCQVQVVSGFVIRESTAPPRG